MGEGGGGKGKDRGERRATYRRRWRGMGDKGRGGERRGKEDDDIQRGRQGGEEIEGKTEGKGEGLNNLATLTVNWNYCK